MDTTPSSRSRPGPAPKFLPPLLTALCVADVAWANPQGLQVQSGTASAVATGPHLNITAGHNAVLQWSSFNIAPGESTTFHQPGAASVVWNRIHDANPSHIWGQLHANGVVVLMNQSGFFFGPNSVVRAAGLVVTTMAPPPDFAGGGLWQFNGAPPSASIVNYGTLEMARGGSAFLIAEKVENHGTLVAPDGTLGLYAGKELLLSDRPDGRGLSARVRLPSGSVDQSGRLVADGGTIAVHARTVNQNGLLQADTVRSRNGVIELVASDSVQLGSESRLRARGGEEEAADAGHITVRSDRGFTDAAGSVIDVGGGAGGGAGGTVAISAPILPAIRSTLNGSSGGGRGGELVIDPKDIRLAASGSAPGGQVGAGDPPEQLIFDAFQAFQGFSRISLQATRDITVDPGLIWNLADATGLDAVGCELTLSAGRDLRLANRSAIDAAENWSVTLEAGVDFNPAGPRVSPGQGSIVLEGNAYLQAGRGNLTLSAGKDVTVKDGAIRTVAGGSIHARALSGDILSGNRPNGFKFLGTEEGYFADSALGGISTGAGGNVTLEAGRDVVSYLPIPGGPNTDGGSGAFGAAPGDVTVTAGGNVLGHYVVRNGVGRITAENAGTREKMLALSLVKGGWEVTARTDLRLQEVRNPNGIFNNYDEPTSAHRFDYDPAAYVRLTAGQALNLVGGALPRNAGTFEQSLRPIYAPSLFLEAGAGGITLGNDVTLFPSPLGRLEIRTHHGGSVVGAIPGDLARLTMSDSGRNQYTQFGDFGPSDHAPTLLHLEQNDPVRIDVAGDLRSLLLTVPKRAEIDVAGDLINARFQGQNLRPQDVTRIWVGGDIWNRNEFTSVPLEASPDFTLFDRVYEPPAGFGLLRNQFIYDARTHQLTFRGRMTAEQRRNLADLRVIQIDPVSSAPILDSQGLPVVVEATFVPEAALDQLFAASQDVPRNPGTGYRLGGPGLFEIEARNLDLGATRGILSTGSRDNPALAALYLRGADLRLRLRGDLDMFSTSIATLNGGFIDLDLGGRAVIGSSTFVGNDLLARGIFNSGPDDVTVTARGDILINGSRIAAYDGGTLRVTSLEGNVDAGTGGQGSVPVEKVFVDPLTREVRTYTPTIPGSGILATSFPLPLDPNLPFHPNPVGDIFVSTPRGNIIASAGGIVQVALNRLTDRIGRVVLVAGKDGVGPGAHVFKPDARIDATGSGVIGGNVTLDAAGEIVGVIFARNDLNLDASKNVNVTALAQGNASVKSESIQGTVIGISSATASAASVEATVLSQNATVQGTQVSGQVGFAQTAAAGATSQASSQSAEQTARKAVETSLDEQSQAKTETAPRSPTLKRVAGRVTVILPTKPSPKP